METFVLRENRTNLSNRVISLEGKWFKGKKKKEKSNVSFMPFIIVTVLWRDKIYF